MPKVLIKALFFFTLLLFAGTLNLGQVSADSIDKEKDKEELVEINEKLEVLVEKVNEKLRKGETQPEISVKTKSGGTLTLGVSPELESESAGELFSIASVTKNYSAFVSYSGIGFDFSHRVSGTYQTSLGKVGYVSYGVGQTGWAYAKTHNTHLSTIDPSVKRLISRGYFSGISIPFKQYVTSLDVTFYGSGNYRVTLARID